MFSLFRVILEKPPGEVGSAEIGLNDMLQKILVKMEKFLVLLDPIRSREKSSNFNRKRSLISE